MIMCIYRTSCTYIILSKRVGVLCQNRSGTHQYNVLIGSMMSRYIITFSPTEIVLNSCGRTSEHQFLADPRTDEAEVWCDWREHLHPLRTADARGCRLGGHVHIQLRILTRCQLQSPRPPEESSEWFAMHLTITQT